MVWFGTSYHKLTRFRSNQTNVANFNSALICKAQLFHVFLNSLLCSLFSGQTLEVFKKMLSQDSVFIFLLNLAFSS